jgi:nucleotide-binding universal stress UspA family protein
VHLPNRRVLRSIPADAVTERMEEERVVLAESVAGLTTHYPDLVVHQVLETDESPARALVAAARTAQLLVVGSRGRGSLQRLLMGSVSHEVLLHITCPTIVTRTTHK